MLVGTQPMESHLSETTSVPHQVAEQDQIARRAAQKRRITIGAATLFLLVTIFLYQHIEEVEKAEEGSWALTKAIYNVTPDGLAKLVRERRKGCDYHWLFL